MKKYIIILTGFLYTINLFSQPVINFFTPVSGPAGTTVTIKGTGFSTTPSNNIVYFGAVKTIISDATDTTLIVTVPAGATYQPITVTTNNLTAYSTNPFVVTFAGGGGGFSSTSFLPKIDFTTGMYPHCVLLADFNQDGRNDVLVSRGSSSTVSIFPNTSSGGSISFAPQLDIAATGNNHEGAAVADFDGDGKLDFVITNSNGSNSVSVFRNTSTGSTISFAAKIDFAADNGPYSVAAGDLDGDGKPDLAIANNGSNKICVYRNTSNSGSISFAPRIDYTVGTSPYSVAIGDLNADGKPELVITTQATSSALSVMKNTSTNGTISFENAMEYASISGPYVVSVGDLDSDGKPDVVVASAGSFVVVLKNSSASGIISFSGQQSFATGNYTVCVSIGDLNGDGKPDLVTSNRFSNNVSALRNTTVSGNISFDNHIDYPVNTDPFYTAVGDLDGDSRPDIISANSASTAVSVLKNIIGTNIAPVINSFTPTSGINGTSVTIIGSNFTGATSVKFGGVSASSFIVDSATGITAITGPGASGDVTVTTANGTATLSGFIFNGPIITSFSPVVGVAGTIVTITGINFTGASEVKFGSIPASSFTVNSSTTITATVGAGSSGSVSVTTANGTAALAGFSFGAPTIIGFTPGAGIVGSTVTITGTNFNATPSGNTVFFGAVKATVSSATSTQLTVSVPAGATYKPISVSTNNLIAYSTMPFNPTFVSDSPHITTNSFLVVGNFGAGNYPSDIAIKDLNDDGKPDIVTANTNANTISVLKNSSTPGTVLFNNKVDFVTGPGPKRIAIDDIDGDGKPDIVIVNFNAGNASTISIFRNNSTAGTISFAPKADYATGNGSLALSITDMNADGKPDIVVTSGNSGFFSIFKNTTTSPGNISLAPKQDFTLLLHPDYIITADLDKDGRPDIITSNFSNSSISVFRNVSTGGNFFFDARLDYGVGTNPSAIASVDMDADGKLDLVVSNYTSASITLIENNSTPGSVSMFNDHSLSIYASNISVADLNGDSKPDLYTGRGLSGLVSVFENIYEIGFTNFAFAPNIDFTVGNYDTFVSIADLDGDGKPELAAANTIFNSVAILKNVITEPAITSLSVTSAGSGTAIVINGRNFTGATSVKFGGNPANSFTVVSPVRIDAVIGGGASGDVTVTTASGSATITGFSFIPSIIAGGPTTFCGGDAFLLLTSSAIANNQWYKDGVIISGATATTLQATTSGIYTVKTTSNGITTVSPTGITVTAIVVPLPVITKDASNNLISSALTGNQWYLNGNIIAGATNQIYQPVQSGTYTVKNTANGCTSDFSAVYNYIITGIINLGNNQFIKLYPNPVKEKLNITWNISSMLLLNIELTDVQGRQILVNKTISSGSAIDLSLLADGVYFIRIYSNKFKINKTVKIIK